MIWEVLGPEVTVRLGHGTVLCVVSPLLAHVADVRHQSQYGLVYGLYSASYNMGLGVGTSYLFLLFLCAFFLCVLLRVCVGGGGVFFFSFLFFFSFFFLFLGW